jgi:hypothetical protein
MRGVQAINELEAPELLRLHEEARIREMETRIERKRAQKELERGRLEELPRKKREQEAQSKLGQIGTRPIR